MSYIITVKDALSRPLFQNAMIEAGHKGLDNEIRWVHILEISNIETLIKGGELILSTGIGLKGDAGLQQSFISQLISLGAAGLCIELGNYLDQIPEEMIKIANRADFPLISFRTIVRFVDITEDLHSIIIQRRNLLRERADKERENGWIVGLVENRMQNEEHILMSLGYKSHTSITFTICLIRLPAQNDSASKQDVLSKITSCISQNLEMLTFRVLRTLHKNQAVLLVIDERKLTAREFDSEIERSLQTVKDKYKNEKMEVGIGRFYERFVDAHHSYREAEDVLKFKRLLPDIPSSYRKIGSYRLLLQVSDSKITKTFIEDFIEPVIRYDRENNSNLLKTLRVYLGNINSKQLAAKQLYIHRQTFYLRLDKLKELLGEDFMKDENRLNIELALRAYDLLHPGQER